MKYCTSCGTPNDANTNFCSKCGQSLNQEVNQTNFVPAAQVNGQAYYGKPRNGKATASMVLGIIAVVWALIELCSFGEIEQGVIDAFAKNDINNVTAGKIGFFIGYNIISLPCSIIGLILGLVAKKNGKAIAGIITSAAALIIVIISLVLIMSVEI